MTHAERPIDSSDYERLYALLQAYRTRDLGSDELLWEILHRIHEDELGGRVVNPADVVGDSGIAHEVHHAFVVLEALKRGKSTVRINLKPPLGVCGTPGCPATTHAALCLDCELKAGGS